MAICKKFREEKIHKADPPGQPQIKTQLAEPSPDAEMIDTTSNHITEIPSKRGRGRPKKDAS